MPDELWITHMKLAWFSVDIKNKYGFESEQYHKSHQECIVSLEKLREAIE